MTYEGLTPEQYEKAYNLTKKYNCSMVDVVDEIEFYAPAYDSIDEILDDLDKFGVEVIAA